MRRVEALDRDLAKVLVNRESDAHAAADNRSPAPLHNDLELRSPAPRSKASTRRMVWSPFQRLRRRPSISSDANITQAD